MNNFHISIPISGLIKREDYRYEIVGLGGNWPATATPSSGLFTASSKSANIKTSISFLATTGSINNQNILPYNLTSHGFEDKEIFTNVVAKAVGLSDNSNIFSATTLVNCSGCLPNINLNISGCGSTTCGQYSLTSGNIFDFISLISGLEPNTKYNYDVKTLGANWPTIMISPTGGSFVSNSVAHELKHKLIFCPYSGNLCGTSNVLEYNLAQCFNRNNLYANIQVSLIPEHYFGEKIFSNNILLNCKNCLPKVTCSLPSELSLSSSNRINITGSFSGLIPNTSYNYNFTATDSNWPSLLKPISGSFVAGAASENIVSTLMFCSPSGNCPSGTENLLSYSLDTLAEKDFNQKQLYTNLVLNLSSECGDSASSRLCSIKCDNCLPCVRYANAVFNGSPVISLDEVCCSGQKLLKVNVTNAVPGDKYLYTFNHTSGIGINNIVFNPSSGEMYFGSGGNGSINTICNVDLTNHAQTLLNFELTHVLSNNKVFDTVGLMCNTGC